MLESHILPGACFSVGMPSSWVCAKLLSKECLAVTQEGYLKTTELSFCT